MSLKHGILDQRISPVIAEREHPLHRRVLVKYPQEYPHAYVVHVLLQLCPAFLDQLLFMFRKFHSSFVNISIAFFGFWFEPTTTHFLTAQNGSLFPPVHSNPSASVQSVKGKQLFTFSCKSSNASDGNLNDKLSLYLPSSLQLSNSDGVYNHQASASWVGNVPMKESRKC